MNRWYSTEEMQLPQELIENIRAVCVAHGIELEEPIRALSVVGGDDRCLAYHVWGGPAFGQERLQLDVLVVGQSGVYFFSAFTPPGAQSTCGVLFLDTVTSIFTTRVEHEASAYVLTCWSGNTELYSAFGGRADLPKLERLRTVLVAASERAKAMTK